MSGPAWKTILDRFRGLVRPPDGGLTDAQLLSRWLASRDEAAFELIVWRHGPAVRGACRRLLSRPQDVEDAFQATFLVFLRKAGGIGKRDALASWLYGVAYRVALQARRRSPHEESLDGRDVSIPAPPPADAIAGREVRRVLDEEVNRLPRRYRAVFVLRCLEGRTNEEAARELGVPAGTVQSRLSRARARLRSRLTRRGVTRTAGGLAAGGAAEASAALPAALVRATVRAALSGAAGQAAAAGAVTPQAVALAKGALHAMWMTKVQMTAAVVLSAALLGGGAFTYGTVAAGPGDGATRAAPPDEPARQVKAPDGPAGAAAADDARAAMAEAQRLRALLAQSQARQKLLEEELSDLRKKLEEVRHPADVGRFGGPSKAPDARAAGPGAVVDPRAGQPVRVAADRGAPPPALSGEAPPATTQAAEDAVEVLTAQLQVKRAELQAAMVDRRADERVVSRVKALAKSNAVSIEEVNGAEDKLARQDAVVQVKEAELHEQEVRLRQATRRRDLMRPAGGAPGTAPQAGSRQELQELRKEVERLLRKVESLERATGQTAPGTPRP